MKENRRDKEEQKGRQVRRNEGKTGQEKRQDKRKMKKS